jgi:hypothetical protein
LAYLKVDISFVRLSDVAGEREALAELGDGLRGDAVGLCGCRKRH